ncbi:hypothetical protein SK128_015640, partial [Halocaridina rubra]
DTNIKHIPLKRFTSHDKTKSDLIGYLVRAILDYKRDSPHLVLLSALGHPRSNQNQQFEDNSHEETDPLTSCLAVEASRRNPDAKL